LTLEIINQFEFFNGQLPACGSVDGYYPATVISSYTTKKRFVTHAVVIDKDFNVVHDPNPAYQKKYPYAEKLGYNGIIGVTLFEKV
jgi:hypothetical protein